MKHITNALWASASLTVFAVQGLGYSYGLAESTSRFGLMLSSGTLSVKSSANHSLRTQGETIWSSGMAPVPDPDTPEETPASPTPYESDSGSDNQSRPYPSGTVTASASAHTTEWRGSAGYDASSASFWASSRSLIELNEGTYGNAFGDSSGKVLFAVSGVSGNSFNFTLVPTSGSGLSVDLTTLPATLNGLYAFGTASITYSLTYRTGSNGSWTTSVYQASNQSILAGEEVAVETGGKSWQVMGIPYSPTWTQTLTLEWSVQTEVYAGQGPALVPDGGVGVALLGGALIGLGTLCHRLKL